MRLIDADLLREHLFVTESRTGGSRDEQAYEQGWDDALKAVMVYEPTVVDAVEVVRCKDCKHCYVDGENVRYNVCDLNHNKVQTDDWFCPDAERREDDGRPD